MKPPRRPVTLLRPLRRLHRRVLLHRRALAALAAGAAALAALQVTAPPPPETVPVWTASRDLAGGTVLQRADLAGSRFAPGTVPEDAVSDPAEVVGRTLGAPLSRGEVVTARRTVSRDLLGGYPGSVAVPLRVTDAAVVGLLRVGDRVSFVVADPDGRQSPAVLVEDVPVVAVPRAEQGWAGGTPGRLVVVAVPEARATEVAARAATAILVPVWDR